MRNQLEDLIKEARSVGWACADGTVGDVRAAARSLGYAIVPNRKDDADSVTDLGATTADAAHPRSLSAISGLGPQPLHTDGAHLRNPPKYVVLGSEQGSSVATRLVHCPRASLQPRRDDLMHSLFTVRNGADAFLAPAMEWHTLRYDPGCMAPADGRAFEVDRWFAGLIDGAHEHEWKPGTVLIVDNGWTLHARGDATHEPERQIQRISFDIPIGARR